MDGLDNKGLWYLWERYQEYVAEYTAREKQMEKYAVVLDPDKEKTASQTKACPRCGEPLDENGLCPNHGTEPLEKRPEEKK